MKCRPKNTNQITNRYLYHIQNDQRKIKNEKEIVICGWKGEIDVMAIKHSSRKDFKAFNLLLFVSV